MPIPNENEQNGHNGRKQTGYNIIIFPLKKLLFNNKILFSSKIIVFEVTFLYHMLLNSLSLFIYLFILLQNHAFLGDPTEKNSMVELMNKIIKGHTLI